MSRLLPLLLLAGVATPRIHIATIVETFHWRDPFKTSSPPPGFEAACTATRTLRATQHMVQDLEAPPPAGLEPWSDAIPYFFGGRPFPGSWDGVDHKGAAREVVKMSWTDVPASVRVWIKEKQAGDPESDERYLFAVYEGAGAGERIKGIKKLAEAGEAEDEEGLVVFFAAGALYEIMPLWVTDGSDCEAELSNLENYSDTPADGKVVAWPIERTAPERGGDQGIEFTIKAQVLRETEEGRLAREEREREEARLKEEEEASRLKEEEAARLKEEEEASEKEGNGAEAGEEGQDAAAEAAESPASAEAVKDEL